MSQQSGLPSDHILVLKEFLSALEPGDAVNLVACRIREQLELLDRRCGQWTSERCESLFCDIGEGYVRINLHPNLADTPGGNFIRYVQEHLYRVYLESRDSQTLARTLELKLRRLNLPVMSSAQPSNIGPRAWWRTETGPQTILAEFYAAAARLPVGTNTRRNAPRWKRRYRLERVRTGPDSKSMPIWNVKIPISEKEYVTKALRLDHPLSRVRCYNCIAKDLACLIPVGKLTACMNCASNKLGCSNNHRMASLSQDWWTDAVLPGETPEATMLRLKEWARRHRPIKPTRCWLGSDLGVVDYFDPGYDTEFGPNNRPIPMSACYQLEWFIVPDREPGRRPGWKLPTTKKTRKGRRRGSRGDDDVGVRRASPEPEPSQAELDNLSEGIRVILERDTQRTINFVRQIERYTDELVSLGEQLVEAMKST